VIFLVIVFIGGSLLAPQVYSLVQSAGSWNPWQHTLSKLSFDRYVTRSCEFLALACLWPFLKSLGFRTWSEAGICPPQTGWRRLLAGLALGFISLALVALIAIVAGVRSPGLHHPAAKVFQSVVNTGLVAMAVATLEELLFRGVFFGALRKACGWIAALVLSSGFFALVHFLGDAKDPDPVTWLSGFASFGEMLNGLAEPSQLIPGFLTLFLVGAILALAYQRTGNLYFSIGLHAGWIFWQRSYGLLTRAMPNSHPQFWGTSRLRDGWLAFLILSALLAVLLKWPLLFGKKQDRCE